MLVSLNIFNSNFKSGQFFFMLFYIDAWYYIFIFSEDSDFDPLYVSEA